MDFPKKQQQCLIPRYLLQYLTSLQTNHDDPTAPWGGGGGGTYTAGDGIEISDEDVISIDDTVALKTDLLDYVTTSELTTELSNYVTSTDLAAELLNYAELSDLATVATTGSYNDLLNKPTIPTDTSDLTNGAGYITSSALTGYATETWVTNQGYSTFSGSYNDLTNKPDLSIYETKAEAFSGDYNDLTNKPTIPVVPTNISAFTNDSGYITSSALTGYATESWVSNQGYLTSVSWNDILSKPTFSTVATSGSYNDLSDKPTIPDAVSGTNDGTNWTSLTIGSDTYGLASGSTPANMVTTDTTQSISGVKTFTNEMVMESTSLGLTKPNGIYFSKLNTCFQKGLYAFDSNSYDPQRTVGELEFNYTNTITRNGKSSTFEYYTLLNNGDGTESQYRTPSCVGFQIRRNESGTITKKCFLAPRPAFGDSWDSAYDTYDAYYIPMVISDGTTKYYANEQGIVTIPAGGSSYTAGTGIDITNDVISIDSTVVALKSDIPTVPTNVSAFTNDAGYITGITSTDVTTALGYTPGTSNFSGDYDDLTDKPTIPDAVSGTNDGTNWTSLTIGSDTYGIPSGGGSGSGPTITRYTYTNTISWPANSNAYGYFQNNTQKFNIYNASEGDTIIITLKIFEAKDADFTNISSILIPFTLTVPASGSDEFTNYSMDHKNYYTMPTNPRWCRVMLYNNSSSQSDTKNIIRVDIGTNPSQYGGWIQLYSIEHYAY